MITYNKLKKKPRAFRSITGMSIAEFDELYRKFVPVWTGAERERLSRPDRKRAIGGGHPYALKLRERIVNDRGLAAPVPEHRSTGLLF